MDACAAAAGVALIASGLLAGLDRPWLLLLLAASYAAWAVGLRASLRANWTLLLTTGTSTNVLSKAAYDLARRTSSKPGVSRLAAAFGYAGTQVAAEGPYYAGAFGAAAFSDAITSTEALGFLAGANLAAALYEYGLARITAGVLRRRRRYASFDTDWEPAEYLAGYYRAVEPDEVATIAYLVNAMRHAEVDQPVLFFGVGPTLHHVFAAAETASEIHLGDYLPANLAEIRRWIRREPGAHDWRPFVRYTLQCEGTSRPTDDEITAREDLTRTKITKLVQVDARHPRPVDSRYPTVISRTARTPPPPTARPGCCSCATSLAWSSREVCSSPLPYTAAGATPSPENLPRRRCRRTGPPRGPAARVRAARRFDRSPKDLAGCRPRLLGDPALPDPQVHPAEPGRRHHRGRPGGAGRLRRQPAR